ncbi:MAG: hypothetical protein ACLTY5_06215 [Angelakisella sp.]
MIIYVGCGGRGNEMTQVLAGVQRAGATPQPASALTGPHCADRQYRPTCPWPPARRLSTPASRWPEYYRDMGYHVAMMADSTSRWAEALREISGRLEEMPAEEGFPAYLPSRLAEFYEARRLCQDPERRRRLRLRHRRGQLPGQRLLEPVTQNTKRFAALLSGRWTSRLAYAAPLSGHQLERLAYSEYLGDLRQLVLR